MVASLPDLPTKLQTHLVKALTYDKTSSTFLPPAPDGHLPPAWAVGQAVLVFGAAFSFLYFWGDGGEVGEVGESIIDERI